MIKYVVAMFMVGVLGVSSAFAGNCHNNVQQVVVEHYVQPVRQQFVEVVDNHHHDVQRVVVRNNNIQKVQVQRVVVNDHHNVQAVKVQKVVVNNNRGGRSVQRSRSVTIVR